MLFTYRWPVILKQYKYSSNVNDLNNFNDSNVRVAHIARIILSQIISSNRFMRERSTRPVSFGEHVKSYYYYIVQRLVWICDYINQKLKGNNSSICCVGRNLCLNSHFVDYLLLRQIKKEWEKEKWLYWHRWLNFLQWAQTKLSINKQEKSKSGA